MELIYSLLGGKRPHIDSNITFRIYELLPNTFFQMTNVSICSHLGHFAIIETFGTEVPTLVRQPVFVHLACASCEFLSTFITLQVINGFAASSQNRLPPSMV